MKSNLLKYISIIVITFLLGAVVAYAQNIIRVRGGGTGAATLPQDILLVGNGLSAITGTSSPTVGHIYASSTTATSTFAGGVDVLGGCLAVSGNCFVPGSANWGSISGALSTQSDLQAALDGKLTVSVYFASTTPEHITGLPNLSITQSQISDLLSAAFSTTTAGTNHSLLFTTDQSTDTNSYLLGLKYDTVSNLYAKANIAYLNGTGTPMVWLAAHDALSPGNDHFHFSIETKERTSNQLQSRLEIDHTCDVVGDECYVSTASGANLRVGSGGDLLIVDGNVLHENAFDLFPENQSADGFRFDLNGATPRLTALDSSVLELADSLNIRGTNSGLSIYNTNASSTIRLTGESADDYRGFYVEYGGVPNVAVLGTHNTADSDVSNDIPQISFERAGGINLLQDVTLYGNLNGLTITESQISDLTHYTDSDVSSYLTGGTGITESAGTLTFDCSEVEGTGINCTGGEAIELDATGDWTGTLDNLEAAQFLRADASDTATGEITFSGGLITTNATATNATTTGVHNIGSHLTVSGTSATSTIAGGLTIESTGFVYDRQTNSVGIGQAPTTTLTVTSSNANGTAHFQTTGQAFANTLVLENFGNAAVDRGTGILFKVPGSSNAVEGGQIKSAIETAASNAYMSFSTRNSSTLVERMRITAAGNVGVATDTPMSKLAVDGTVSSTECFADASNGDCVDAMATVICLSPAYCDFVADGTDDEDTFKAAFNFATTTGNGKVIIKNGDYYLNPEELQLTSNMVIEGEGGRDSARLHMNASAGSSARLFRVDGAVNGYITNIEIRNLYFINDENPLGTEPDTGTFAIKAGYTASTTIEKIRTEQFHTPVEFNDSNEIYVNRYVDYSGQYNTSNGAKNLVSFRGVDNSTVENSTGWTNDTTFRCAGCQNVTFFNNDSYVGSLELSNFEGRQHTENIKIIENRFHQMDSAGISCLGYSTSTSVLKLVEGIYYACYDILVEGNTIEIGTSTAPASIDFTVTDSAVANQYASNEGVAMGKLIIKDNIINGSGESDTASGIKIGRAGQGRGQNIEISGNKIRNLGTKPLIVWNSSNVQISNNEITNYNRSNGSSGTYHNAGISIMGTTTRTSDTIKVHNNILDANYSTNGYGIYLDDSNYFNAVEIYDNLIKNATTSIVYETSYLPPSSRVKNNFTSTSTDLWNIATSTGNLLYVDKDGDFFATQTAVIGDATPNEGILTVGGNIHARKDNSYIGVDDNSIPRIGFTKKAGSNPFIAFGATTDLLFRRNSSNHISSGGTFTTLMTLDAETGNLLLDSSGGILSVGTTTATSTFAGNVEVGGTLLSSDIAFSLKDKTQIFTLSEGDKLDKETQFKYGIVDDDLVLLNREQKPIRIFHQDGTVDGEPVTGSGQATPWYVFVIFGVILVSYVEIRRKG